MGVTRLWSYLKTYNNIVLTEVDLVQLAKGYPGGMKLLVDFYCWEHFIANCLRISLTELTGNPHLVLSGGEYKLMHEFHTNLIQAFRSVNIELVFFVDGAKGSGHFSTKHKLQTWKKRFFEDQRRLAKCFEYLRGEVSIPTCLVIGLANAAAIGYPGTAMKCIFINNFKFKNIFFFLVLDHLVIKIILIEIHIVVISKFLKKLPYCYISIMI